MKRVNGKDIAKDERVAKILASAAELAQHIPGETCEQEEWLFLYLNNGLSKKQREWIENHLASCKYCRTTVEAVGMHTAVRKDLNYYLKISGKLSVSVLKFIKKPFVVVPVAAMLCLIAYNVFVMDYAAVNERLALAGYDSTKTMEDAYAYSPLLRVELGRKVAAGTLDSSDYSGLVVFEAMIGSASGEKQLGESRYILKRQYQAEAEKRGLLAILDFIVAGINDSTPVFDAAGFLLKKVWAESPKNTRLTETLELAYATDRSGESEKAISFYVEYVKEAGLKEGEADWIKIKLREAYCRLKNGDKNGAYTVYDSVEKLGSDEKKLCSRLKTYIRMAKRESEEADLLIVAAGKEKEDSLKVEKLRLAAKKYMYSMDYKKAVSVYENIMVQARKDDICFALAWCRKNIGQDGEAKKLFASIKEYPDAVLLETAGFSEKEEAFESAAEKYIQLAKTSKNKELASLAQFKAGCVYLHGAGKPYFAEDAFTALSGFEDKEYKKYYDLKLAAGLQKEKLRYVAKTQVKEKITRSSKDKLLSNEKLPAQYK